MIQSNSHSGEIRRSTEILLVQQYPCIYGTILKYSWNLSSSSANSLMMWWYSPWIPRLRIVSWTHYRLWREVGSIASGRKEHSSSLSELEVLYVVMINVLITSTPIALTTMCTEIHLELPQTRRAADVPGSGSGYGALKFFFQPSGSLRLGEEFSSWIKEKK